MDYILSLTGKGNRFEGDSGSNRVWPAHVREVYFKDSYADDEVGSSNTDEQSTDTGQKKDGRRMSFQRPKGTIEYSVETRDTLNSIALKFDTTPNELVQLNKLFSRSVVPGQALYVPDPEYTSSVESSPSLSPISPLSPTSSEADLEKATTDSDGGPRKEATPSPAHILHRAARVVSSTSEEEEALTEKFLKINCKYITEGKGAVSGVLLVTPNNIMFDPHKADPLVQARGCEEYGIMCPLEEVVSAAMYKEITDSKVRESVPVNMEHLFLGFDPCRQQRTAGDPGNDSTSTAPRSTEGSLSEEVFTESELSPVREELWQKSSCPSSESVQTVSLANPTGAATHNAGPGRGTSREESDPTESQPTGHLPPEGPGEDGGRDASSKRSVCDREGAKSRSASESHGSDTLGADASGQGGPGNGALAPDAETRVREPSPTGQSHTKLQAKEPKEDVPETHSGAAAGGPKQEVERQGSKQGLAVASREKRRHRSHKFLCLRVGKPMKKTFVSHASATMQQYAQRDRKHEYWFAVPQERSDHLYVFFIQWSPDVYGEGSSDQGREPRFTVVKKNEQSETGEDERPTTDITAKEWEISTKEEVNSKYVSSIKTDPELEPFKPNLTVPSDLLQAEHIEKLSRHLPPRTIGYPWTLAFSTSRNGMSMKTLYRTMQAQDSPVLMVIKDADSQLFGALASEPLKVSDGFYGTGETFLFTFCPDFEVFKWTGDNMFFIKGDMDSLAFGGGGGEFGLWLDGDLYHGRSHSCKTFGNPILTKKEDFVVQDIEIWSFE